MTQTVHDDNTVLETIREAVDSATAGKVFGRPIIQGDMVLLPVATVKGKAVRVRRPTVTTLVTASGRPPNRPASSSSRTGKSAGVRPSTSTGSFWAASSLR